MVAVGAIPAVVAAIRIAESPRPIDHGPGDFSGPWRVRPSFARFEPTGLEEFRGAKTSRRAQGFISSSFTGQEPLE